MKTVRIHGFGGPEVMRFEDAPDPAAGPGEIVIDIHAASVNPADWKVREGAYADAPWLKLPHVCGRDFSGVVRAIGEGVSGFATGDEVFGVTDQGQEGTYAEAIAMKAAIVAPKPARLSHAESAAIALGALTAMVALEDTAKIQAGETVLVQGGAGGVGAMGVQLAKHAGCHVIATARAANLGYLRALGADQAIAYDAGDFRDEVAKCDVVFDTVGGEVQVRSCDALKPGGKLVWISRGPEGFTPPDGVVALRPNVARDRTHLERIAELADAGALKPPEITMLPLAEAARAQELRRTGAVRGKVVLLAR